MPVEISKGFPPRKFYISQDDIEDLVIFDLQECVAQYLRDVDTMDSQEFLNVYENFNPEAILDFCTWRYGGFQDEYTKILRAAL